MTIFFTQGSDTLIGAAVSDSGCGSAAGGKGLFTQISGIVAISSNAGALVVVVV